MALRETLNATKAAKEAAKAQAELSVAEQEKAQLKEQFDALITKRAALAEIKKVAADAYSALSEKAPKARGALKELRSIHKESVDEDTGEAAIPKASELIRSEEYQDEEEVVAYKDAREEFRLSVKGVREVRKQLKELGIDDADSLLPGQLESVLEETDRDIDAQTRAFVLEHPDVDPEMSARVRAEVVADIANRTGRALDREHYFTDTFKPQQAFGNSYVKHGRLENAVREGIVALNSDRETRQSTIKRLRELYPDAEGISEFDTEALELSLARQIVSGYAAPRKDYYETGTWLARKYNEGKEDGKENADSDETSAVESLIQEAVATGMFRPVAESYIQDYKALREYEGLPEQIRIAQSTLTEAEEANRNDERVLRETQDQRPRYSREAVLKTQGLARDLLTLLPALRTELGEGKNEVISVKRSGDRLVFRVAPPFATGRLEENNREEAREIKGIEERILSTMREKISFDPFGKKSKDKQDRISALDEQKKSRQDALDISEREVRRTKEDAAEIQRRLEWRLEPYMSSQFLSETSSGGSVAQLLNGLNEAAHRRHQQAETALEELKQEAEQRTATFTEVSERIAGFSNTKTELRGAVADAERRKEELERRLKQAGYLN
ncbi:MAG: Large Ala/Glu-rich protein [Parcubacteria bacterium C7867-008]|nr:MAG: Large Ala/Glu-rich protein [Parcubacteria bacterium C7867-008]